MLDIQKNDRQRFFIIPEGDGYSCLGFDVCERKRIAVLKWLGIEADSVPLGSFQQFASYRIAMRRGAAYAKQTGQRCPAELIPEFIGREHERVEITTPDGERSEFYIGKSSGWMPCHIEIKTRRSDGGAQVYVPDGSKIRFTGERL